MLRISSKSLNLSSLITPLSFGEGSGVRLFLSFGEVVGGEAVCFILCLSPNDIPVVPTTVAAV